MASIGTRPQLKPGDLAPDFCLPSAEGREVTLSEFRGRSNVLIVFLAGMT